MAIYVDGFVIPIPKNKMNDYKKMARGGARVWMKHGALSYYETVGDDFTQQGTLPFPKMAKLKKNEVLVFSWITYKSKAHRDAVNKKVFNDPWMQTFDGKKMPFDIKRMACGGFKTFVKGK